MAPIPPLTFTSYSNLKSPGEGTAADQRRSETPATRLVYYTILYYTILYYSILYYTSPTCTSGRDSLACSGARCRIGAVSTLALPHLRGTTTDNN